MKVRDENVPRGMFERLRVPAVDAGPTAVHGLIPSSRRNNKRLVAVADTAQ